MIELKAGLRVKVYGTYIPFKGTITGVSELNSEYLFVTEDGFYSAHNDSPFHWKACRILVKMKKCHICNGKGSWEVGPTPACPDILWGRDVCAECNGIGKVKK